MDHVKANSGNFQFWIRIPPLVYKGWNFDPPHFLALLRTRLRLNVTRFEGKCPMCRDGWMDRKGRHALSCPKALTPRHHALRDLVAKVSRNFGGWEVKIEQGRDPLSKERPGDVLIFKFENGRDCYVDTFVVDALLEKRSKSLNENGPGAPATDYEPKKVKHYEKHFSDKGGDFVPFGVTAQGGVEASVKTFCKKMQNLGCDRPPRAN